MRAGSGGSTVTHVPTQGRSASHLEGPFSLEVLDGLRDVAGADLGEHRTPAQTSGSAATVLGRVRNNRVEHSLGRRAIADAARQILTDRGLSGITLSAVAARADVSEDAVRRWWPSRDALALDVLRREWIAIAAGVRGNAIRSGL